MVVVVAVLRLRVKPFLLFYILSSMMILEIISEDYEARCLLLAFLHLPLFLVPHPTWASLVLQPSGPISRLDGLSIYA